MDADRRELTRVLQRAKALLALPGNDLSWSSWQGPDGALWELDEQIAKIEAGSLPDRLKLAVLFAPTGPIQEVSVSSGWGYEFLDAAARFDPVAERVYA
jgi:hypothetical protein